MEWFSPCDAARRIGSLISISATEALVNLTKAGAGQQKWLLGNRVAAGEVNEFIFIDNGQDSILGRIVKVYLEGGERLSVEGLDDLVPENNPIGVVQLLVSVDSVTGKNYGGIKQYPKLGSQVYSAHSHLVTILIEGKSENYKGQLNLPIAELPNDPNVTVHITPEQLFARHCAILGSTGGGKSYTVSKLVEEVARHGGKAILIDATGEYSKIPGTTYYVGDNPLATEQQKVTYPHWLFTESDIRSLLRPSAQSQAPKLDAAIQSLKVANWCVNQPNHNLSITLTGNIVKAGKFKQPFEYAVTSLSQFEATAYWHFHALADQVNHECVWPNGGTGTNPNHEIWGNKSDADVGHCLNLISRIKALSANTNLKWMIDADARFQTIPNVIEQFCSHVKSGIIRLDLSAVPFEANAREILVNAIGRKLLACARNGQISHKSPLIVFIDESHQFLNKKVGDESARYELDAFGNIAKEGRKYGLNVAIATQRPRDIPEDVLSQIGTLIVHRLTNPMDQELVKKAVGSIDSKSASFLPILGQGEALILGIDFPFPMTLKIKLPTFPPDSRSATFSAVWKGLGS